jgi:hypothetical protein
VWKNMSVFRLVRCKDGYKMVIGGKEWRSSRGGCERRCISKFANLPKLLMFSQPISHGCARFWEATDHRNKLNIQLLKQTTTTTKKSNQSFHSRYRWYPFPLALPFVEHWNQTAPRSFRYPFPWPCLVEKNRVKSYCSTFRCYLVKFVQPCN